ncbi:MAG: hypothetical protein FWH29_10855 [Methanobrevibacter sp.]|nr:hypothetical protein [Methanobrevibacter sp.]
MPQEKLGLLEKNKDLKQPTIAEDEITSSELENNKNLENSPIAKDSNAERIKENSNTIINNDNKNNSTIVNNDNKIDNFNNHPKYWIHKFPFDLLKNLNKEKKLGLFKKKSNKLGAFTPNDKILIFTKLNNKISFIAYTMVDEIVEDDEPLYKTFLSPKKLSLKGIKYIPKPVVAMDLASKLDYVKDVEKSAIYYKSEFREISQEDFKTIIKGVSLVKNLPTYLEKQISFSLDDFIKHTIKILYGISKSTENQHQIEIKTFLQRLKIVLDEYGVKKSSSYLENFYAMNAYKFGFKHNPSRDPDKSIFLFNSAGNKRKFGYISLID